MTDETAKSRRRTTAQPPTVEELAAEGRRTPGAPHGDDSLISRFDRWDLLRFSAGDSVKAIVLCTVLLVLFAGGSVRHASDELDPGIGRDIVRAIGEPTGWISDQLPLAEARRDATAWLSPDEQLKGGGFGETASDVPPASPNPAGPAAPAERAPLESLLVTGDSLSTPLDIELARKLADTDVEVIRDPHLATGISNTALVDWGQLSTAQVAEHHPQAVVVFIGANEGYPMPSPTGGGQVSCCGAEWESIFSSRVSQMMSTYTQGGEAHVYWLTVPTPRDPDRARIEQTVNEAIKRAASSYEGEVRVIDTVPVFTPGEHYRDAMDVDGSEQIVRESDGIHLNETGSSLAADVVLDAIDQDYIR